MFRVRCDGRWIGGLTGQVVGQSVVDIPVMRLVCANHEHHVAQRRVVRQLPVPPRNRRGRDVGRTASIDLLHTLRIAEDRLLLEIADQAVRPGGRRWTRCPRSSSAPEKVDQVLLWVYYSSLILLFGAAFTKTQLLASGRSVVPRNSAVLVRTQYCCFR